MSGYDQVTGLLDYRQTWLSGTPTAQNLTYQWDRVGNLAQREDNNRSLTEHFYYDNLHRLDYSTLNSATNLDVSYDFRGNIMSKTGVGSYAYHASKLHAVSSINTGSGTLSYSYDANGNMTNRGGTTITWFGNNLPRAVGTGLSDRSEFRYTPDGMRWRHFYLAGGVAQTHTYIGGLLEKVVGSSVTAWKHYVHANGVPIALHLRDSNGNTSTHYLLKDHLGSTDVIAQEHSSHISASVPESFDAFSRQAP